MKIFVTTEEKRNVHNFSKASSHEHRLIDARFNLNFSTLIGTAHFFEYHESKTSQKQLQQTKWSLMTPTTGNISSNNVQILFQKKNRRKDDTHLSLLSAVMPCVAFKATALRSWILCLVVTDVTLQPDDDCTVPLAETLAAGLIPNGIIYGEVYIIDATDAPPPGTPDGRTASIRTNLKTSANLIILILRAKKKAAQGIGRKNQHWSYAFTP